MRIMITGSRDWPNAKLIQAALLVAQTMSRVKAEDITLIHGNARGADRIAAEAAADLGWATEAYLPNWTKYGKRAGVLRNIQMLESNPDIVLAFQWNGSKGTQHAIDTARKMGIPVKEHPLP